MDYTPEFELFWIKFPSRWNKGFQGGSWVKRKKRPAFEKWQKLSPAIQAECLYKVKYIKSQEGGTVRDCVTWLNQYGWEDIELEVPEPLPANIVPIMKGVSDGKINVNNERNKQTKGLRHKF